VLAKKKLTWPKCRDGK